VREPPSNQASISSSVSRRAGGDEVGHRDLARLVVGHADHRRVGDVGMREKHRLELGRGHLEALDLDELLHPVRMKR
jgi:hypothetical protein